MVALRRAADGGSAIDLQVVRQVLSRTRRGGELERLTPREREVLDVMAQGLSDNAISERLVISQGAVEQHIGNVFRNLDLEATEGAHRRVLAVLAYLGEPP